MARFLFVVLPLRSHLSAALAVGQALSEAGHEVAWCGPETDLRPVVGTDDVIFATGKRYYREYSETGMAAVRVLWTGYLVPFNRFIHGAVDRAVTAYRPDVVVADQYAFAGALAALRHGRRWATLCLGALELTPPADLPELAEWVDTQLARIWAASGVARDPALDLRFSPELVLALTTRALTGDAALPAACELIGPALGDRPGEPDFEWFSFDPSRKHVLVTVGTLSQHMAADFFGRLTAALADATGVQAVFVAPAESVPDPPPHIQIVPRVPMLELLPRLDAVVCHAGMGTVSEALAYGVPLVLAPMRHDQPVVARQVADAGAGVVVSFTDATAEELARAVHAVLDEPGYKQHARRIGASFRTAGGVSAAVTHLVSLARVSR